jgi:hypothetical protein
MISLAAFFKSDIVEAREDFGGAVAAELIATFGARPRPLTKWRTIESA